METNNSYRTHWRNIVLATSGLLLCLILLEVAIRLGGGIFLFLQEHKNRLAIQKKGTYRIMCLGESTTASGGNDSYPSQLEEILNQCNIGVKFSVINRGIPGVLTSGIVAQLEDNIYKYKPDMIVTMMGINDEWNYILRKDIFLFKTNTFFESLKVYKLARLLWTNIVGKVRQIGIHTKNKGLLYFSPFLEGANTDRADIKFEVDYTMQDNLPQIKENKKSILQSDRGYLEQGWYYMAKNELTQAEEMFNKAIELNPNNYEAHVDLGWCYRSLGKFFLAEQLYKKGIELTSYNDRAYFGLAMVYIDQNKLSQAETVLKKAIEIRPNNDKAYALLGTLYDQMGRRSLAQEYLKKSDKLRMEYYNPITRRNYQRLKELLDKRGIKLVCVQYPMRSIEPLKQIFDAQEGIIFVDNEKNFLEALKTARFTEYFTDTFGGDFGHCTRKGNRLIAENIANVILKECFGKETEL